MIVLDGHGGFVTALAYSSDGRTLAVGDSDGRVRLWDPLAGRELVRCGPLHPAGAVTSLSFSGDGKLVAGGFRGEALVWSTSSGQVLHWHRMGDLHDPTFVAFHPSNERLLLASGRFPIAEVEPRSDRRFRALGTQRLSNSWYTLPPPRWCSLLFCEEFVAAGGPDAVWFWPPGSDKAIGNLHWPNGDFIALTVAGQILAGARGRGVTTCDLNSVGSTIKRTRTFKLTDQVNAIALTPDGRTLLAGGDDWTVHVWDVASGQKRADYNWRLGQVTALAVAPDGMTVAVSGRKGGQVLVWDLE